MRKIKLLKWWQGHLPGEIVEETNNVAFGLVDSGTGKYVELKDLVPQKKVEDLAIKKTNKRKYANFLHNEK